MKDEHPCCLILTCLPLENSFVWMHLVGTKAGRTIACNFKDTGLWAESLCNNSYDYLLRGDVEINIDVRVNV